MNVAVINLARRADRLAAFQRRWHQAVGDVPVSIFTAVDLLEDPSVGCLASHVQLLGQAPPDEPLLVLEDDAVFAPNFSLDWPALPLNWQLLRLGGRLRGATQLVGDGWVQVAHVQHTHAYVARHPRQVAQAMVDSRETNAINALAAIRIGHYAQRPQTVGQAPGPSDIRPAGRFGPAEFWHGVTNL